MSNSPLPCLACGHTSFDVKMKIIDVPEAERRLVSVAVVVNERRGQPLELAYLEVPERYVREPRCRDTVACKERVAEFELAELAAAAPIIEPPKEEPAWTI